MNQIKYLLPFLMLAFFKTTAQQTIPAQGMVIRENTTFKAGTYLLEGHVDSLKKAVILVEGHDLLLDFSGVELMGSKQTDRPDQFFGCAILISGGHNITIKNLKAHGYKVALMVEGVRGFQLIDCDFSNNYRQRLYSGRDREDLSDWLSYHQNDNDEWLRYGAGVYMKDCANLLVRGLRVHQGQNGLMMMRCNEGQVYNCDISFNSGVGIGMYRCNDNKIMHNKLDWNVRGYSDGFYQRGQDSAGILCYEQSSNNTFAYNSVTHSGDGFFLWAGQSTMDDGQGGCNNNLIYKNDFSHAPTNGIEVTFSSNNIVSNKLDECTYGIWGGYSWKTVMVGNTITHCKYGIAIEHGQNNTISNNYFADLERGVWLWERKEQPTDWGYAQSKDVRSRDYNLWRNAFVSVKNPLFIASTKKVIINDDNSFYHFDQLLTEEQPNEDFFLVKNNFYVPQTPPKLPQMERNRLLQERLIQDTTTFLQNTLIPSWAEKYTIPALKDGMDSSLPADHLQGRRYILVNEWGPYDFSYPVIWLREVKGDVYTFEILGPQGNWEIGKVAGFTQLSATKGSFPAMLLAHRVKGSDALSIPLKYIGPAFTDQLGVEHPTNQPTAFEYYQYDKQLTWQVEWHAYDEKSDPLTNYEGFKALATQPPLQKETTTILAGRWWGAPKPEVPADKFATFAQTQWDAAAGTYRIIVSSDDGVKVFIDDQLFINHWDVHEPATDEKTIDLKAGKHKISIEHFDAGGLAALDFRLKKIK